MKQLAALDRIIVWQNRPACSPPIYLIRVLLLAATGLTGCSCSENPQYALVSDSTWEQSQRRIVESAEAADSTVFFVARYDPDRDPFEDLAAAVRIAQADGKRILLVVGGAWCGPCLRLDSFWAETPSIRERLIRSFVVMKVHFGSLNHNERFLSQFAEIHAYPHIFVLDANGKATIPPVRGLGGGIFDEKRFSAYLDWWTPDSPVPTN